jgi:predicted acyl esterase
MGGLSVPAGTAGFLAPCATDDRLSQVGPWATSYTTAPLSHAETVAGPITATVYASATTSETQLVAELEEVTPDGTSYPLTEGALLGSLRAVNQNRSWTAGGMMVLPYHPYTQASATPVTPGQMTEYQIQIFPTLDTIAAGDSLRLTLSTADTPHLTPLPNTAQPGRRRVHNRALGRRAVLAHARADRVGGAPPARVVLSVPVAYMCSYAGSDADRSGDPRGVGGAVRMRGLRPRHGHVFARRLSGQHTGGPAAAAPRAAELRRPDRTRL